MAPRGDPRTDPAADLVAAAQAIAPLAREHADAGEDARRLAAPVVAALRDAGLFRLCVPKGVGGAEAHPVTMVRCIEAVAAGDGAAGWCLMIGATSGLVGAWLDKATAAEVMTDPGIVIGGVFAPKGTAEPADGGIRLSGRWAWGSGSQHCDWLMGGVVVDGTHHMALVPAQDVRILDTWRSSGLRGTGSHDLVVEDVFVPDTHLPEVLGPPSAPGTLYRIPFLGVLALGIAGVAMGIARTAIEELAVLAGSKVPTLTSRTLGQRTSVQGDVARAESLLKAGGAVVNEAIHEAWASVSAGRDLDAHDRASLRLAATSATRWAADAVDLVHGAAGGTAVLEDAGPIARCFRDIHVVTQHLMVAPATYELVGRVRLGIDPDGAGL